MAQKLGRLTALKLTRTLAPGMHADGGGLVLQVTPTRDGKPGGRSWIFRYMVNGRERYMGLGSLHAIGLAAAREAAAACRRQRALGLDPIDLRKAREREAAFDAASAVTFRQAADRHIEANKAGWSNPKHGEQWKRTLEVYAHPHIGPVAVRAVDTPLVLKCLEPIWQRKTETANRVRGRIEAVLDSAKARGQRDGENPARWKGHLENLLPKRSKVQKVKHHPALPYAEVGKFMERLRTQEGTAAKALQFLILTASRTGAVIDAQWPEVDLENAVWTIPNEQGRKLRKPHRVPLCPQAVAILKERQRQRDETGDGSYVFPGDKKGRGLSNNALLALLGRMGREDLTAHGFRSTFRDWAAEQTNFPREVAEMALAHVVDDKTEAAYRRGDMVDRRRQLMNAWGRYCATVKPAGEVVKMRDRRA